MIHALEKLELDHKVKLTIPLVATYLKHMYTQTQIANICNISPQAVSDYIKRHYDDLAPLVDKTDSVAATQSQHLANIAKEKIVDIIDTCKDFGKRDLIPLTAVSDRHTQQYRLLSDKATQNVSVVTAKTNIKEIEDEQQLLLKDIDRLENSIDSGSPTSDNI